MNKASGNAWHWQDVPPLTGMIVASFADNKKFGGPLDGLDFEWLAYQALGPKGAQWVLNAAYLPSNPEMQAACGRQEVCKQLFNTATYKILNPIMELASLAGGEPRHIVTAVTAIEGFKRSDNSVVEPLQELSRLAIVHLDTANLV